MATEQPQVEPCFRCGQPAERPVVGAGHLAGRQEERVPLCVACLELLQTDAEAFWQTLRTRREEMS